MHFASSNVLRIQFADPTKIERKWESREKGIAADITLDKDTYGVGEDVALHLAIEDFDAEVPVFGPDPLWDPCNIVNIEVHDATGHKLTPSGLFSDWSVCTGHGALPTRYEKRKVIALERDRGADPADLRRSPACRVLRGLA
ncbi:MAG TPA: hypothetical protein VG168_14790 [Bryobacteraceae bacterium]|nr:hypothetical protein [Bryobacteraceae bacterium]